MRAVGDDPNFECVERFFYCLSEKIPENEFPRNLSKAKTLVYMVSKKESRAHLRIASKKRYWKFDHPVFEDLKEFLKLFNTDS